MKTAFLRSCAILLALGASACATRGGEGNSGGGVEVARFHLGERTIAKAQIAIEPFDPTDARRPEYPAYAAAVARELGRLGWTVVNTTGQSEQIALIDVEQGDRNAISALSAARIGRGMPANLPETGGADGTATLLEVAIRRRSDATVFWEGRAVTAARAGSPESAPTAAAERLAAAVFEDFPGESGRTIRVR